MAKELQLPKSFEPFKGSKVLQGLSKEEMQTLADEWAADEAKPTDILEIGVWLRNRVGTLLFKKSLQRKVKALEEEFKDKKLGEAFKGFKVIISSNGVKIVAPGSIARGTGTPRVLSVITVTEPDGTVRTFRGKKNFIENYYEKMGYSSPQLKFETITKKMEGQGYTVKASQ